MYIIQQILETLGYDGPKDLEHDESITIENGEFMSLVIRRESTARLLVMHPHEIDGEVLRDPGVVFDTDGDAWTVVSYRDDPAGTGMIQRLRG